MYKEENFLQEDILSNEDSSSSAQCIESNQSWTQSSSKFFCNDQLNSKMDSDVILCNDSNNSEFTSKQSLDTDENRYLKENLMEAFAKFNNNKNKNENETDLNKIPLDFQQFIATLLPNDMKSVSNTGDQMNKSIKTSGAHLLVQNKSNHPSLNLVKSQSLPVVTGVKFVPLNNMSSIVPVVSNNSTFSLLLNKVNPNDKINNKVQYQVPITAISQEPQQVNQERYLSDSQDCSMLEAPSASNSQSDNTNLQVNSFSNNVNLSGLEVRQLNEVKPVVQSVCNDSFWTQNMPDLSQTANNFQTVQFTSANPNTVSSQYINNSMIISQPATQKLPSISTLKSFKRNKSESSLGTAMNSLVYSTSASQPILNMMDNSCIAVAPQASATKHIENVTSSLSDPLLSQTADSCSLLSDPMSVDPDNSNSNMMIVSDISSSRSIVRGDPLLSGNPESSTLSNSYFNCNQSLSSANSNVDCTNIVFSNSNSGSISSVGAVQLGDNIQSHMTSTPVTGNSDIAIPALSESYLQPYFADYFDTGNIKTSCANYY